ncbi:unnamed protein product [Nezara viridula]|uniref:Glycoprotein endo-alpha-1,2-mannosidase n=1 Tax=Nezara viridula TaxID=85310 RepID=A0A9P0HH02_NEZVI|nr:unnamed protein product [Nezara viridula]
MKSNYNFWCLCLSTCIQKIRTLIIGCIYYKITRLHHKFILPPILFILLLVLCISLYQQRQLNVISKSLLSTGSSSSYIIFNITSDNLVKIPPMNELKVKWVQNRIEKLSKKMKNVLMTKVSNLEELPQPNYRVHIFYYAWFKTPKEDGSWQHWNKELVSQKKDHEKDKLPPEDIYSSFYPYLGCYSSKNMSIIDYHMKMIRKAGIGVVVLSWLPPSFPDSPKDVLRQLMDVALKYELKVAFQIYFYTSRTHKSIAKQIQYLMLKVGDHPSLYLLKKENKLLPVFYIHESYKHSSYVWKEMLSEKGNISLRKTKYDGTFIGHLSDQSHITEIKHASFDGLYTYSSGNGFTYGSSWKNWNSLAKFCQENTLMFIPSVGPGFSDILSIKRTRHRLKGNYYEEIQDRAQPSM